MSPNRNLGSWIHIFTVTDTQTHKDGYTIYKITSVIFPRSVPQALTCLTVWKRFHDIKRLHRELSRRQKSLQLNGKLPEPTDCSFFKRFDADVIQRRKEYILQLLDFIAQYPALYKCHTFAQFFSDAQQFDGSQRPTPVTSPAHKTDFIKYNYVFKGDVGGDGNADADVDANVDASADIGTDVDKKSVYKPKEKVNGIQLLDPSVQLYHIESKVKQDDKEMNCLNINTKAERQNDMTIPKAVDKESKGEKAIPTACSGKENPCKDYTRFLTPMASIESDDSDYIYEAALEFSHAVQAEVNLEYQEAYVRYKRGVEFLLNGSREDANDERKFIAKAKISKYMSRANDIYDKFMQPDAIVDNNNDKSNFQLSIDVTDSAGATPVLYLERPWNHLAKYKVFKVLGEQVLQVQCITEPQHPTYVMKGIEKPSSNSSTQTIFLPQHVPYMVELLAFFQSEQKIFLLFKQAEGGRLLDYVQSYKLNKDKRSTISELFPEVKTDDNGSLENVYGEDCNHQLTSPNETIEFSELVRCSQELLESVSNTLKVAKELEESKTEPVEPVEPAKLVTNASLTTTKLPEASLKQWTRELAVAIHSLHGKGVILSDLCMNNLLLGSKGQLLLTYFYQNEGLHATADNCTHKALSWQAVAGHYVAPERPLTFKSDWWSYGVLLYQLILGVPFKALHPGRIELYGCVQYPEHMELSENAQDLLENLLEQTPEARFGYEQIQAHDFFKDTNWEEVRRNGLSSNTTTT